MNLRTMAARLMRRSDRYTPVPPDGATHVLFFAPAFLPEGDPEPGRDSWELLPVDEYEDCPWQAADEWTLYDAGLDSDEAVLAAFAGRVLEVPVTVTRFAEWEFEPSYWVIPG